MPLGRHEIYVHLLIIVFLLKNCTKLNMIAMSLQPAALTDSRNTDSEPKTLVAEENWKHMCQSVALALYQKLSTVSENIEIN